MLKLLTDEGREKVSREYKTRRLIVIFLALIFVSVITVIGLLPSYILSNGREQEAFERLRFTAEVKNQEEGRELRAWLVETNKKISVLAPELDVDRPSDFVEGVLNLKLLGIKITNFSWSRAKDKITLSISGTASDRQTLVRFEDGISQSELFSDVILPISDLANDRNISFQIKFSPI